MMFFGSLQLLNSAHVRERNKALLGRVRGHPVPCRFCGAHLFRECTFPPLVEILENPEFHDLMRMDKGHGPRCLLWHGWLPLLSGANGGSPSAEYPAESAAHQLECALGSYSSRMVSEWSVPERFGAVETASRNPDVPHVRTDGSLVLDEVGSLLISLSFAGVLVGGAMLIMFALLGVSGSLVRVSVQFRGFFSVQRAELWGVLLAFQSSGAVHFGVDSLNVVRHVGDCWTVVAALLRLSLSKMVIFFCSFIGCFFVGT